MVSVVLALLLASLILHGRSRITDARRSSLRKQPGAWSDAA